MRDSQKQQLALNASNANTSASAHVEKKSYTAFHSALIKSFSLRLTKIYRHIYNFFLYGRHACKAPTSFEIFTSDTRWHYFKVERFSILYSKHGRRLQFLLLIAWCFEHRRSQWNDTKKSSWKAVWLFAENQKVAISNLMCF